MQPRGRRQNSPALPWAFAIVLEGGVQLDGNRLRVTVRLIENRDGTSPLGRTVRRDAWRAFILQDVVTSAIVSRLIGRIENDRLRSLATKDRSDWEAEDYWFKGREALRRVDFRSLARARHYFRRALEKSPDFARAHAGLAMTEIRGQSYFNWQPALALGKGAFRHALRAVQLDANDHQTHCILGLHLLDPPRLRRGAAAPGQSPHPQPQRCPDTCPYLHRHGC